MSKLIHANLTYTIRGVLFDVYNKLGPSLPETFYQQAVEIGLNNKGIPCQIERGYEVYYRGQRVGLYYVDVWIDGGKVILELKVASQILPFHKAQAIAYLKVTNADLAMLVNFGAEQLQIERLPNFIHDRQGSAGWQPNPIMVRNSYPDLTKHLIQAMSQVHHELGPGFLPQIYRRATRIELQHQNIPHTYIKQLPITYQNQLGSKEVWLIQVTDKIVIAVMSVKEIDGLLKKQFRARLKFMGVMFGLLANFHGSSIKVVGVGTTDT
ncbi:GxxExxY protein [Anaerolineales bacterium HSG24]|nr:GxxExxY protein [Anaerolineales bacterium HSG24]